MSACDAHVMAKANLRRHGDRYSVDGSPDESPLCLCYLLLAFSAFASFSTPWCFLSSSSYRLRSCSQIGSHFLFRFRTHSACWTRRMLCEKGNSSGGATPPVPQLNP